MNRIIIFCLLFLTIFAFYVFAQQGIQIQITEPPPNSMVPWRPWVKGTVSDSTAKVWVVAHPKNAGGYWVQPAVDVGRDGRWSVKIYIGEFGKHVGVQYAIMAVANPKEKLREGKILHDWPEAQGISQIIEVTRCEGETRCRGAE